MPELPEQSLISHLEALRGALLRSVIATVLLLIPAYLAAPYAIAGLVKWSCPAEIGQLNYFSPMEVFLVQLKLALILSLATAYPYIIRQVWKFLAPALYERERGAISLAVMVSSVLFFAGAAFCIFLVLPLIMNFSASFASPELKPVLGLANFINLAGWLALAFGVMFQFPILVVLAVRFNLVSVKTLRTKRPYVIVVILIVAAILTPPDVVSQLLLGMPTWLLFEFGLLWAAMITPKSESIEKKADESQKTNDLSDSEATDDNFADFYDRESKRNSDPK